MDKDLTKRLQEAKSCCEEEILSAIRKFSDATGLQVDSVDYQDRHYGSLVSQSVEITVRI